MQVDLVLASVQVVIELLGIPVSDELLDAEALALDVQVVALRCELPLQEVPEIVLIREAVGLQETLDETIDSLHSLLVGTTIFGVLFLS